MRFATSDRYPLETACSLMATRLASGRVRSVRAILIGAVLLFTTAARAAESAPTDEFEAGQSFFRAGQCAAAQAHFAAAWRQAVIRHETNQAISAMLGLGAARQQLGQLCAATEILEAAHCISLAMERSGPRMRTGAALGAVYGLSRHWDQARQVLQESLQLARQLQDLPAQISILENLANLLAGQPGAEQVSPDAGERGAGLHPPQETPLENTFEACLELYGEAGKLAAELGDQSALARVWLNQTRAYWLQGDKPGFRRCLEEAFRQVSLLPGSAQKARWLASCGKLALFWMRESPEQAESVSRYALQALEESRREAALAGDLQIQSYAYGFLGELYETGDRLGEAIALTETALYLAQKSGQDGALLQWKWQLARLLHRRGESDKAAALYESALQALDRRRSDFAIGQALQGATIPFRNSTGGIYYEYADLLLERAARSPDGRADLLRARDLIEALKQVEVEDYFFADDCVNLLKTKTQPLDVAASNAAIIYFIPLPDRTEILVSVGLNLRSYRSPATAQQVTDEIRRWRQQLQNSSRSDNLGSAQRLWKWLMQPLDEELRAHGIDTLIYVPDGALRSVPLAALHDGEHFLVERYALAVNPGLSLLKPGTKKLERDQALLCGISDGVRAFRSLPGVKQELEYIGRIWGGTTLLNTNFTTAAFAAALSSKSFPLIHVASHGSFGADASQTFILTYDGALTLDRLQQLVQSRLLSEEPLELLVLSACTTAVGDDRSALGLAGIAIKAGARSTIATLWRVDDDASRELMVRFYQTLRDQPQISKAQALCLAQRSLLHESQFTSPRCWAPYLLIGSWQ